MSGQRKLKISKGPVPFANRNTRATEKKFMNDALRDVDVRETVMPAKKKKKVIGTKCGRVGERPGPSKASLQLNRSMQDDEYRGTRPGTKDKKVLGEILKVPTERISSLGNEVYLKKSLTIAGKLGEDKSTRILNKQITSDYQLVFEFKNKLMLPEAEKRNETSKKSFTKVRISIPVHRNSSYDEFVASIMQIGELDCAPSDVVISYVMHSREKMNPTIINSDVRVLTYIMDADADGFRLILRINVVERSFEGPLNSSAPPPRRPTVDDDLIDDGLNDYENDIDDAINMENYSMHMEDFSSDSQDDEEDRETESQAGHSFTNGTNFCCGQTFTHKKELKIQLDAAVARQFFNYYMEKSWTKLMKAQCLSRGCG
ncbi:hypothetical protein T459_22933 [Capsicum annuum]|uniref:Uncharacterized protein n=1 Tax=Capsicum annuum TaxID=4072 RepID=A0A2G2YQX3_CAPAN|nr:hypothetical protein FXO37_18970 [Capsicum annuum]PHT72148.1 hypothetical protein T459_22933 [Capsicum annuum]